MLIPVFMYKLGQRCIRNQEVIMYMGIGRHFLHDSGHFTRYLIIGTGKDKNLSNRVFLFEIFAGNQFILYEKIYEMPELHKLFEACYRDNLHSIWAVRELYTFGKNRQEFCHILEKNMQPVYDSARRQGYEIWNRDKVQ